MLLSVSDTTAADLDSVGQHLTCLQSLPLQQAEHVTLLAAPTPLDPPELHQPLSLQPNLQQR
jgi:hypothetical protein